MESVDFVTLKDQILISVENTVDEVIFTTATHRYKLYHQGDCCESVTVDDICGDLKDLLNYPILLAEESSSNENPVTVHKEHQDSFTWTFYKLATIMGSVTIRWYGESNGYYSESVSFGVSKL